MCFYGILWAFKTPSISTYNPSLNPLAVDRSFDQTIARSSDRSIDVHKTCTAALAMGRSTGPSTDLESLLSRSGTGRPISRPTRECTSGSGVGWPDGRPSGKLLWGGRPSGRPITPVVRIWPLCLRSTAQSTTRSIARLPESGVLTVDRPRGRSAVVAGLCTFCAHRSTARSTEL